MILGCLTLNDIEEINMGHEFWHQLGELLVIIVGKNLKYVMLVIPGHKYVLRVNLSLQIIKKPGEISLPRKTNLYSALISCQSSLG